MSDEGELAELEDLSIVQRGKVERRSDLCEAVVGAEAELGKEPEVGVGALIVSDCLDLGGLEELGEDEGVRRRGCALDEVDGGGGRGCGFG